jgi:3-oxoadipate enol-lactonase
MNTAALLLSGALDVRNSASSSGTVVLVHGLGGTLNVWEPQTRALAEHFRVVRYDLPGSGRRPARDALSVEEWVTDLEGLLDVLEIQHVHLIGHSLGTLVVQHFAARWPHRVDSLSLLGVNRSPPDARRAAVRERAEEVRKRGLAAVVDALLDTVPSPHTRAHKPIVLAAIRELVVGQDATSYAWTCEAMAASTRPDISSLVCPLLLIAGADDNVSPADLSRAMATEFPVAKLIVLPDCGHWIPLEQPERTCTELLQFLQTSVLDKSKETA